MFKIRPIYLWSLAVALLASGAAQVRAQTAITNWSVSLNNQANTFGYGGSVIFQNETYAVTSLTTAVDTYVFDQTASDVFIRRNTAVGNNNYSTVWHNYGNSSTRLRGTYEPTLGDVLLGNNVAMGTGNLFVNSSNPSTTNAANIERVDFYLGQTTAVAGAGLTIFDRGLAGATDNGRHDYVNIAVFTAWDTATNTPTAYSGNVVQMAPSDYGTDLDWNPNQSGTQSTFDFTLLRFDTGDNLTSLDSIGGTDTQGVAGAFISFADLGIAAGTQIYGYSIMAADVTTNIANLANWNNATYYPTGTNDLQGGIDLMAFNGRIARPVPEPSTYGALLLGGSVVVWWLRRRKLAARA